VRFSLLAAVLLTFTAPAAQNNVPDHPLVSRFQGSSVVSHAEKAFDDVELPLGPTSDQDKFAKSQHVEGKVTSFKYTTPKGRSTLEVSRSYRDALEGAGFQILYACSGAECFTPKFPYGYTDSRTGIWCRTCAEPMRYLAAKLSRPSGDAYVSLLVDQDQYEGGTWLTIVEVKPMAAGSVTVNAAAMAADISSTGHASIYGIYFDTGQSTLKPESDATLAEIAKLLSNTPSLKLHVIGHTDNVGSLTSNMTLSKQRAAAVVAALTGKYHIAASRLDANGVGSLAPVATNRTEDGRAKNRRVELVEQ
jgi:OOP family OmpA-OmpF porin